MCVLTGLNKGAFADCAGLTSVIIPNSVEIIAEWAFSGCSGLASVTIGKGVTNIGNWTFAHCTRLVSIAVKEGNGKYIVKNNCLVDKSTATLVLGCQTSVIPGDGSVESIGAYAFNDCIGLASITIPNTVASISSDAFSGCTGLTNVTIGKGVTIIGRGAFSNCSGLTSIVVKEGNSRYIVKNNCLIDTLTATLVLGCQTSVIPGDGSVKSIGDFAFYGCIGLTNITIPDSVTNIGLWAFVDCSSLTKILYSGDLIGWLNIRGLDELMGRGNSTKTLYIDGVKIEGNLVIPDGITSISGYAFYCCSGLTSVTIQDSVTSIGSGAFSGCSGLKKVFYAGTAGQWTQISIANNNTNLTSATRYYYSDTEPDLNDDGIAYAGNYWHYDTDGTTIIIWKKEK